MHIPVWGSGLRCETSKDMMSAQEYALLVAMYNTFWAAVSGIQSDVVILQTYVASPSPYHAMMVGQITSIIISKLSELIHVAVTWSHRDIQMWFPGTALSWYLEVVQSKGRNGYVAICRKVLSWFVPLLLCLCHNLVSFQCPESGCRLWIVSGNITWVSLLLGSTGISLGWISSFSYALS